ncbi:MAG: nitrilase-related carbon-nitrogen hydrolase, partial [Actinomadura sp.]
PEDFAAAHPAGASPDTPVIRGGSCIVDPFGTALAGPSFGSPGVIVADVDLDLLDDASLDLDVVGHYARPDIFDLHVTPSDAPRARHQ